MSSSRLRLVVSNSAEPQTCSCRAWGLLRPISRDLVLDDFMRWADLLHQVHLKLLARGEHVAICELMAARPGHAQARYVMTELCSWADCARVILEISPSNHWGSETERLSKFYESMGFEQNREPEQRFLVRESMIRYPVRGRGHVR